MTKRTAGDRCLRPAVGWGIGVCTRNDGPGFDAEMAGRYVHRTDAVERGSLATPHLEHELVTYTSVRLALTRTTLTLSGGGCATSEQLPHPTRCARPPSAAACR